MDREGQGARGGKEAGAGESLTIIKKYFWISRMDVLEKHDAKKHCLDSEVALQPPIPLHTMGQRRYFWIPRMGVFEMGNAKKYCSGSGVAPPLYPTGQQR